MSLGRPIRRGSRLGRHTGQLQKGGRVGMTSTPSVRHFTSWSTRSNGAERHGDGFELHVDVRGVGLSEHGPDGGGDHVGRPSGTQGCHVPQDVSRHRCQPVPSITAAMACSSQVCTCRSGGEMTSCAAPRTRTFTAAGTRSRTCRPPSRRRRTRALHSGRRRSRRWRSRPPGTPPGGSLGPCNRWHRGTRTLVRFGETAVGERADLDVEICTIPADLRLREIPESVPSATTLTLRVDTPCRYTSIPPQIALGRPDDAIQEALEE